MGGGYKKDSYILNLFAQTKQYSASVSWTLYAGHTEYINSHNTTNQIHTDEGLETFCILLTISEMIDLSQNSHQIFQYLGLSLTSISNMQLCRTLLCHAKHRKSAEVKSFSTSSLSHNFENFPVISYSVSSKSKSLKKTVQEKYHTGNHGYLVHSVVFNKWLMSESLLNLLLHPGLLSRSGLGLLESFHCNQQPTCCFF